jgi:hypothetical protein
MRILSPQYAGRVRGPGGFDRRSGSEHLGLLFQGLSGHLLLHGLHDGELMTEYDKQLADQEAERAFEETVIYQRVVKELMLPPY